MLRLVWQLSLRSSLPPVWDSDWWGRRSEWWGEWIVGRWKLGLGLSVSICSGLNLLILCSLFYWPDSSWRSYDVAPPMSDEDLFAVLSYHFSWSFPVRVKAHAIVDVFTLLNKNHLAGMSHLAGGLESVGVVQLGQRLPGVEESLESVLDED